MNGGILLYNQAGCTDLVQLRNAAFRVCALRVL
jgi:hypothetical protein